MNKKFLGLMFTALCLGSCDSYDKNDIYIPAEYSDILSLKWTDDQDVTLYSGLGEDGVYSFPVLKGGIHPDEVSKASIRIMTDEEFKSYNQIRQKTYQMLPANLYSIKNPDVVIPSKSQYSLVDIAFKSDEVKQLMTQNSSVRYVLPLMLESKTDSVNSQHCQVVLRPEVITPTITFTGNREPGVIINREETEKEYRFTLELPFNSPWDFTAKVVWDNKSWNGWITLGAEHYSIANEGLVHFKKGESRSEEVVLKFKNYPGFFGRKFVLPLKIEDISKSGILPVNNEYWILPTYNKIPLKASMLSTNAQEPQEGPISELIDDNADTFFHSNWSSPAGINGPHYFQVKLENPITTCRFRHVTRKGNANGTPSVVEIQVSADGQQWTSLKRIESGMPDSQNTEYYSDVMTSQTPFTYVRYIVHQARDRKAPTFFSLAEFELFGK